MPNTPTTNIRQNNGRPNLNLFYSYSHKDEQYRDKLATHLDLLKQKKLLDDWHDRRIPAGNEIHAEIDQHFAEADIILLLLSPDYISSRECQKEGCRSGTEESGGMTVDGLGLIGERDFGSIGCRQ